MTICGGYYMIIYILNILHKSISMKLNKNETVPIGYTIMNDARYISCFAEIKKNNSILDINNKLTNFFEIMKKYRLSVTDTFNILEKVIGNNNNRWIIEEVYNYNGMYNVDELLLSKYVGEIIYCNKEENINLDNIYKSTNNMRRVILDSVFNKIKEDNKNNIIETLCDAC